MQPEANLDFGFNLQAKHSKLNVEYRESTGAHLYSHTALKTQAGKCGLRGFNKYQQSK